MFDNITLVTNYHVIEDASIIIADSDDGYEYFVTKVLIADEEKDIAILQFMTPTIMKPLDYSLEPIKRGSSVVAIGSPISLKNTVSLGNVSSVYNLDGTDLIQFTAPISHGSSGGALLNDEGKVIGVTSSFYVDGQNINLAVNISEVVSLYDKWDGDTRYQIEDYRQAIYIPPTPTPSPSPSPSPSPTASPTPKPTPTPTMTPPPTPTPTPTPSPSPTPTASPTPTPSATPTPTPSPTPTPTPVPTPTPTVPRINHSSDSSFTIDLGYEELELFSHSGISIRPNIVPRNDEAPRTDNYTWKSSDENVATVNNYGYISAIKSGDAIITCTSQKDPTVSTLLFVRVVDPVTKLTITSDKDVLLLGAPSDTGKGKKSTTTLKVDIEPASAPYRDVTWSSSNPQVATVDEKGVVKGLTPGNVTITAISVEPSDQPRRAYYQLSVQAAVSKISDGNKPGTVEVGKSVYLKPTIEPENASNKKLLWRSSSPGIATVSDYGQVQGVKAGTCTITCSAADGGGAKLSYTVQVIQPITKLERKVESYRLKVNEKKNLSMFYSISPSNATQKTMKWTVKNEAGKDAHIATGIFSLYGGDYYINGSDITFYAPGKYTLSGTTTDGTNKTISVTLYVEPANRATLYFQENHAYANWNSLSNDILSVRFQVTNHTYGRTVKAFELYVYATNAWGTNIYGNSVYYETTNRTVAPGSTVYSDYINIPNRSQIYTIYCGIHKILYEDGTSVTLDNVEYTTWTYTR